MEAERKGPELEFGEKYGFRKGNEPPKKLGSR